MAHWKVSGPGQVVSPHCAAGVVGTKYVRVHTELAHILGILTCEPLLDSPYYAVTRLSRQGVHKKLSPDDADIPVFLTCPHVSSHILIHPHMSSYIFTCSLSTSTEVGKVKLAECRDTEGSTWMHAVIRLVSPPPPTQAKGSRPSEK